MSPTNDEAPAVAAVRGSRNHENTDTASIDDASKSSNPFARLRAQAEALGFTLIELGAGTCELPGLREVGDLLRQIGGRQ